VGDPGPTGISRKVTHNCWRSQAESELRAEAKTRLQVLQSRGVEDAVIYDPVDISVKGIHALFLLRGYPRAYNLPPQPEVPTIYARKGWRSAAVACP
jgi:formate dehydrogenase iron-sulfur subunit